MPTKNNISIKLVDAETKQPFKEHPGKEGIDAFIEVEPGLEYYIRVESYCTKEVRISFKVDGKSLGYSSTLKVGKKCKDKGLWSYNSSNNQSERKALQFYKAFSRTRIGDLQHSPNENELGIIEISIYDKILLGGYHNLNNETTKSTKLTENTKVNGYHVNDSKKFLKSKEGKTQTNKKDDGLRKNYIKGAKLTTIKIKYCSTVGLIAAGVLPELNLIKPETVCSVPDHKTIRPIIFKSETRDIDGDVVESKDYEMPDMTTSC